MFLSFTNTQPHSQTQPTGWAKAEGFARWTTRWVRLCSKRSARVAAAWGHSHIKLQHRRNGLFTIGRTQFDHDLLAIYNAFHSSCHSSQKLTPQQKMTGVWHSWINRINLKDAYESIQYISISFPHTAYVYFVSQQLNKHEKQNWFSF